MKILVLGADGYLGWPTCLHLAERGHEVHFLDSLVKRKLLTGMGRNTLVPIMKPRERKVAYEKTLFDGKPNIMMWFLSLSDHEALAGCLRAVMPDAIVHYAEQPSAPFSMMDYGSASMTQANNVLGTLSLMFAVRDVCPEAHIVKLGTMGEYGTPNIRIEEGWLPVEHAGRQDILLYPKRAGSFYHLSKVHDSHNLEFGCRVWGLRVTDLNQGVVYGFDTPGMSKGAGLETAIYYDDIFGTALNRFVAQAVTGIPLTVYGEGKQTRGYINLRDTVRCIELAVLNPAESGEFRVFNQFTQTFSVLEVAQAVLAASSGMGLKVDLQHIPNPRVESEDHFYEAVNTSLISLGLEPNLLTNNVIVKMLNIALSCKKRILLENIQPGVTWREGKKNE